MGQSSFNETILKNIEIPLPIKNDGSIDYDYIITFIKAEEKISIKSIVEWKNKMIETTKKIV